MKKTLGTMAAAALMASTVVAPAFAQTSPATPAPASPSAPADPAMKSTGDTAATPSAGASSDMSAANSGSYLTEQAENQISANDYIGKPIYNAGNESIGDVNDLILEENGGIVAAVVGVGGFLGIGEKDVAVPMSKISLTRDAQNNNEVRLTTTETAEALKAAPEFKTLDDKQAETDATTTSSTNDVPASGAATPAPAPKQ